MFSILNLPAKVIGILEANISPREIALGVCLGMFFGFTPLNGTTALLLTLFFFVFRVNRMATLLSLPAFKILYILGLSGVSDNIGVYFLEKANYLAGFWRLVTNLPVLALLDINRTTVAGGLILSAILSIPLYFIVKSIAAPLLNKYSAKMQNTAFSKWVRRAYHVSNLIGPDAASVADNVKATVKYKVVTKIKSAIIKPKARKGGLLGRLNLTRIAIVVAILVVIQVGVGLIISPAVSAFIVDSINRTGAAKVTVEKINVWPLTLSFSMKDLKVFDPKNSDKRIARVEGASVRISPIALLSKRLVFSKVNMRGAELDLEGEPDGTFNIQHLTKGPSAAAKGEKAPDLISMWQGFSEKRDTFGKIYSAVKKRFSKAGQEQDKNSRKVQKVVEDLPKGKLVKFKTPAEMHLFEIRDLHINGRVHVIPSGAEPIELKNARLELKRVAVDPDNGIKLGGIDIRGELIKNDSSAGKLDFMYSKGHSGAGQTMTCRMNLEDVDMDAVRFIYEDSLPVKIVKGKVSLRSNTNISVNAIDSRNSMTLTGQTIEPKQGGSTVVGFIPIGAVCDALNRIDPARLKFDITGTIDKPQFGGFQESLMELIKPYLVSVGEQLKTQGMGMLDKLLRKKE